MDTAVVLASIVALMAVVGVGSASAVGSAKRDKVPPSIPTNVRVTKATPASVALAWNNSTDLTGVQGYVVTVNGSRARISAPRHVATGLACGQSVVVSVSSFDHAGNHSQPATTIVSTAACVDRQTPSAPSGFRQAATMPSAVVLEWNLANDNVGVVGYGVYSHGLLVQSPRQPSTVLSGLLCGSSYEYQVDAVDAVGNRSERARAWVVTSPCASAPQARLLTASSALWWGVCATEGSQCSFAGTREVRYGANGTYTTPRSFTDGVSCSNSVFGDPVSGVRKRCETGETSTGWTRCAGENERCSFSGTREVRYGANGTYTTPRSFTDGVSCSNSVFGDPLKSVLKHCDTRPAPVTSAPTPTPTAPSLSTSDTSPPTRPSSLVVGGSNQTSVSLRWDSSSDNIGVKGYGVYVDGTRASTTSQTNATVPGLECGTARYFEVDAYDAAGNRSSRAGVTASTAACLDTVAPTSPTNVIVTSRTPTSIALVWAASTDNIGVTGYGLYRNGTRIGVATGTTGIFSGLACNTNYTLGIDAYDASGNRSQTAAVMVATTACADTTPPSPPTNLAASNVTQSGLSLTWSASSDNVGVAGYDVFRGGTRMATVTTTSAAQTGLACGTSYSFGVEAFDAVGNRSSRTAVSATTSVCQGSTSPSGPITISQGGTYSGNWASSSSTPAVTINTTSPVTIRDSIVQNTGTGVLIQAQPGAQVTVERVTGNGGEGRFFSGNTVKSAIIRNCTLNRTGGIYFMGSQSGATILVTRNRQRNLQTPPGLSHSSFTQFDKVTSASSDVSWNEVVNVYGQSETSGDMISIFASHGVKVHDNFVQGAYPTSPTGSHSGSGVMVGDDGGNYNEVWNNQIVATTNVGIGIVGGANNRVHDNRIVSDGRLEDGTMLSASNVGVFVWNLDGAGFSNNALYGNTVGFIRYTGQRNDWWLPDCQVSCSNIAMTDPITTSAEQSEYQRWIGKLSGSGITIGS
jgi:chitodextrinase